MKLNRLFCFYLILLLSTFIFISCTTKPTEEELTGDFLANPIFHWVGDENYKSDKNVEITEELLSNQRKDDNKYWYENSVFYHIWVKSFCDSNGDGCGDLNGITSKLDYINKDLGCDAIWLSPIFDCSHKSVVMKSNMHGYDTKDYYKLNELFGTEEDLSLLLSEAHKRNMKIIFDFIPNHTSTEISWFIDSLNNENNKKNWYLWNSKPLPWNPMGSPNTWHNGGDNGYYYGCFDDGMPDLNYRNYEVREEMKNVARYWLNKGFDGMRVDAVQYLVENPHQYVHTEETHQWFAELRNEVIDKYGNLGYPKFMVAETWITGNRYTLNQYFGTTEKNEFNMLFDFEAGQPIDESVKQGKNDIFSSLRPNNNSKVGRVYGTFLGNHDNYQDRQGTIFNNDLLRQKLTASLSILRPTVPFIYYGNEIAQENAFLVGDIRLRQPIAWTEVEKQKNDKNSLLNEYKKN